MADSRIAVYGAIVANVAIAVTKFIVATVTGSSAMLSEGIHSTVDSGNGMLMLLGLRRSKRQATPEHPFGHGKELYFWTLIVGVLIFGVGGGVSVYEGILHILHPSPLADPVWNYVVLGLAALFEGASFLIALRQFRAANPGTPFILALRRSKDPTTYTVIAEDGVALAGILVAAIGIYASDRFAAPVYDGAASIVIGLLLAVVAVILIRASRELLIGEGVRPETAEAIRQIARADPRVRAVGRPLSMYIGPDEVLLTLDVEFEPETPAEDTAAAVRRIEAEIRRRFEKIKRIYIEARSLESEGGQTPDLKTESVNTPART